MYRPNAKMATVIHILLFIFKFAFKKIQNTLSQANVVRLILI